MVRGALSVFRGLNDEEVKVPVDIDALLQQIAQVLGGVPEPAPEPPSSVFVDLSESMPLDTRIRSRFAGQAKLVPIVRKFAARLQEQMERTREALAAGDLAEVERQGHWLAGAAGTVGYDAFTEPALEMEAAAKAADVARTEELLQRLLRMSEQLEVPEVAVQ
jgi:HPt (histidine-containing phosphotransfer) domain-containing protein